MNENGCRYDGSKDMGFCYLHDDKQRQCVFYLASWRGGCDHRGDGNLGDAVCYNRKATQTARMAGQRTSSQPSDIDPCPCPRMEASCVEAGKIPPCMV